MTGGSPFGGGGGGGLFPGLSAGGPNGSPRGPGIFDLPPVLDVLEVLAKLAPEASQFHLDGDDTAHHTLPIPTDITRGNNVPLRRGIWIAHESREEGLS